jgi:tripartite-type tricarboxylate transporter receptor subunit TctC
MQPVGWVPRERFQTIAITAISLQGIYVAQASPHRTLQDLLAAKDLRYGCATSVCNLFIERILAHKRVEAIAVPYKSTPQVIMDLASGQTDFIGVSSFDALPMVQAGMVRPLAFGTEQPMDFYPQIGLFRDVVPGFVAVNFHGLYAPQGTSQHLVDYLNRVYRLALNDPEIREQFKSKTLGLWDGTATQAERYVDRHVQIWRPIVERHYKP